MSFNVNCITSPAEVDCGPTCLAMLINYYGGQAPTVAELSQECGISVTGCTMADLKRVGAQYGLDMHGYSIDAEELYVQNAPAIVWWKKVHFCVFCGLDEDGRVVICNPDRGRYRVSKSMFKAAFCGVALFNGVPEELPEDALPMTAEQAAMRIMEIIKGVRD